MILAIDPGTTESGWCVFDGTSVVNSGILSNQRMRIAIQDSKAFDLLAVEMIASYGMPVGREVFETCVWIGRFLESSRLGLQRVPEDAKLIYRKDVKLHLCGSLRAKDANIRQALIDRLGPVGTKKEPGPLYGVKSHAWAALAVAVTAFDGMRIAEKTQRHVDAAKEGAQSFLDAFPKT